MSTQAKIETIKFNDVEYVRADQANNQPDESTDGLQYAIVRSRDDGVKCGYVVGYEGQTVKLKHARQVWAYDSYFVLLDLAMKGPRNASKCRFSTPNTVGETVMLEACGIIPCSVAAGQALRNIPDQHVEE